MNKNIIYVLLGIILLLGGILFIFYDELVAFSVFSNEYINLLPGQNTITQDFELTIPLSTITKDSKLILPGYGNGLTFTWSMLIDNVGPNRMWSTSYTKNKPIIRIGNSPHIYYNPRDNILSVMVAYSETTFYSHYPIIELKDIIPINTWNKYAVVIENEKIKIYFNGKLVVNKRLTNVPIIDSTDIVLGEKTNNMVGTISDLKLYRRPYNNTEIKKIL